MLPTVAPSGGGVPLAKVLETGSGNLLRAYGFGSKARIAVQDFDSAAAIATP
jgi:hypothetical protein